MRISKNFHLEEFVSKAIFNKWGQASQWFVDPSIISLAQFYRDYFGYPITINNWKNGGKFGQRGFREPASKVGASLSQHRFGRAFDCNISNVTPDEARKAILDNKNKFMAKGLTTIEDGAYSPTWIHSDIRWTGGSNIKIVKP